MSADKAFFQYEPEVAARMPLDKLYFTLAEVMRAFGLTSDQLLDELADGRLIASGIPTKDGFSNVTVRADHLTRWMAETNRTTIKPR